MQPFSSENTGLALDAFAHFEHLAQSVLVTDAVLSAPGPKILYANPAFERMTGWPREQIVGRTPRALQGPETDRNLMGELKAALKRGESWRGEATNYRRDGTPFVMKWTIAPVRDGAGHVQRFVSIQEDVTELRRRQQREAHLNALTRRLMAVASEGIVVLDADQRITQVGAGAEQIFGWRADELIGQPVTTLIPERFRAAHTDHVQAFAGGDDDVRPMVQRDDILAWHRDGAEIPVMVTIARLGEAGDQGFVAVVRDLSLRRAQARKLAESERRYRAVFNLSYQFVGLLASDGEVLEANQAALGFFGGKIADVRGKHLLETPLFHGNPEARQTARAALAKAAAGEVVGGQIALKARDGAMRTFAFSIRPVVDADGVVEYLLPEAHDITDLIESTEALKTRERQLKNAQRIARVGDWHWDIASGRLFWSEETYRICAMDPALRPTYEGFMSIVHPEDREALESAVQDALAGKAGLALDHRIVLPDGSERVLHEQGEVQYDATGQPVEMVGIAQDITDQKRMEAALTTAKRDAEASNEAKSRFLSTMGHELRTPLNAVNGFSQLIANETFGPAGAPQYVEYANLILQSGNHLLDVINTILEATRLESGRMEIVDDWFDLAQFLRQTVDIAEAESRDQSVHFTLSSLSSVALRADRRLLRQALLNLIFNAVKFSPTYAFVAVAAEITNDGGLAITVQDQGPGIPAESIDRITLPFVQADDSLSRRHEGSGLGLYLAKSFLDLHDGRLDLSCPPSGGTRASTILPPSRVSRTDDAVAG